MGHRNRPNARPPLARCGGGIWISVTLGWLAVSFVLAALLRTPGCEMRAFRHVWSRLVGDDDGFVACPGPLQPLDEWEARATGMATPCPEHSDV